MVMDIKNKRVSVIGAVRSGIGAARLAQRLGAVPFVSETAAAGTFEKTAAVFNELGIPSEFGGHTERVFDCSLMVVSPGVPTASPVIQQALAKGIPVISEVEFAASHCKGKIIAITGTNGKTTTTTFMGHLLNLAGITTWVAGNIGSAFSEIADTVKADEWVALEVSSFQLDFVDTFKPLVSMILNITPDHLNRYDNKFENYVGAKYRIFSRQTEEDLFIANADDPVTAEFPVHTRAEIMRFSLTTPQQHGISLENGDIVMRTNGAEVFRCPADTLYIRGEHNIANAMAVILAAKRAGAPDERIIDSMASFTGVEHRIELVREIDGVRYVNDSKATNVDSVWYALRSFNDPIFLILGGQDKGNDYEKIRELVLGKVKKIYAIGSSAEKVFAFFRHEVKVEIKATLEDCVSSASSEARRGDIVLLSPACASFDMFRDYEDRGARFKAAVEKLTQ